MKLFINPFAAPLAGISKLGLTTMMMATDEIEEEAWFEEETEEEDDEERLEEETATLVRDVVQTADIAFAARLREFLEARSLSGTPRVAALAALKEGLESDIEGDNSLVLIRSRRVLLDVLTSLPPSHTAEHSGSA